MFRRLAVLTTAVTLFGICPRACQAQVFTVLHTFNGVDGSYPRGGLVLAGDTLYGTTGSGGAFNWGTIFKVNLDGSDYTVLKNFKFAFDAEGADPCAGMISDGTTLYGTTWGGGTNEGGGIIFKIQTNGGGFTVLKTFAGNDGGAPQSALLLVGATLYGTTSQGGVSRCGTIFKINTDGTGFAVLKSFLSSEGSWANGALVASGSTLFGTTREGGTSGSGTVFKINTDGTGFMQLHAFSPLVYAPWGYTNMDGAEPQGALLLDGTTLYGGTLTGGPKGQGTVFSIKVDGSGFAVVKVPTWAEGNGPQGLLLHDDALIGSAYSGGPDQDGDGTIFALNTNDCHWTVLKNFNGADGGPPNFDMIQSGSTLYGTTEGGGAFGQGIVYSLSLTPPTIISVSPSQTAEEGSAVGFNLAVADDQPPAFQWLCNGRALNGCTNGSFRLSNIQTANTGDYSVIATNVFGAATSAPVLVQVVPVVPRRPVPAVRVSAQAGLASGVESSDILGGSADWKRVDATSSGGPPQYYFDVDAPLPARRFYRAWQSGAPAAPPTLDPPVFVPAITLSGAQGGALRLDYINAVGPTNAWVTLTTMRTNTPQLYFDTSAIGQPRRLYRIMPMP